ncbi:MAG TPA: hypothetical protein VF183_13960 [Acidimicrobiales bacterium]
MTQLRGHGIGVEVPRGWDAAVYRRHGDTLAPQSSMSSGAPRQLFYPPILHLATFPLPPDRGDFGGGALDRMRPHDLFVSLLEFGNDAEGAPLFAHDGVPWPLHPDDFGPEMMRVPRPGQSGCQRFFRVGHRAFTLYVVIGSHALRGVLVPRVNTALAGIDLSG